MNRETPLQKFFSASIGIVCVLLAARHLNLQFFSPAPQEWWYLCACAMGLVYSFDLAADSKKLNSKHDRSAALLLALLSLTLLWPARFLLLKQGLTGLMKEVWLPLLLTFVYLTGIVRLRLRILYPFREILAAYIFGCTLILVPGADEPGAAACTLLFSGSCLANLLVASRYDFDKDQQYGMPGLLHTHWFPGRSTDHLRAIFSVLLLLPPLFLKSAAFVWPAASGSISLPPTLLWIYIAQIACLWVILETEGTFRPFAMFRFASDCCLLLWLLA